jgi:hypothetical protein
MMGIDMHDFDASSHEAHEFNAKSFILRFTLIAFTSLQTWLYLDRTTLALSLVTQ